MTAQDPLAPVPFVPHTDATELTSGRFTQTGILNNIFELVLNMTTIMQSAAAAQAGRLTFMAKWQKAYTDVMSQVPTFTQGGTYFGGADPNTTTLRNSLNNSLSNLTQKLQNRQSVVSDDAKALQSNVNQTNDAVNAQSNLGTSIIQELSTLVGAIFH